MRAAFVHSAVFCGRTESTRHPLGSSGDITRLITDLGPALFKHTLQNVLVKVHFHDKSLPFATKWYMQATVVARSMLRGITRLSSPILRK